MATWTPQNATFYIINLSLISSNISYSPVYANFVSQFYAKRRVQTMSVKYTNGQKKGYTVYMSNYSIVNLKHSMFLT